MRWTRYSREPLTEGRGGSNSFVKDRRALKRKVLDDVEIEMI